METTFTITLPALAEELTLHHREVSILFQRSMRITMEEVQGLLTLPKETLAADLRAILRHAAIHLDHYEAESEANGWSWETMSAPMHAIILLSELPGSENLDAVLDFMAVEEDILDFHLGDILTEYMWEPIAKLGSGHFDRLAEFVRTSCPDEFARVMVAHGVSQIAITQPERFAEVEAWIGAQLLFFSEMHEDDAALEVEVVDCLIGAAVQLQRSMLLPLIEQLYAQGRASDGYFGGLQDVRDAFGHQQPFTTDIVLSLAERYADQLQFQKMTERNIAEAKEREFMLAQGLLAQTPWDELPLPPEPFVRETSKVGRNEPCTCGSGKKYKKCCAA